VFVDYCLFLALFFVGGRGVGFLFVIELSIFKLTPDDYSFISSFSLIVIGVW